MIECSAVGGRSLRGLRGGIAGAVCGALLVRGPVAAAEPPVGAESADETPAGLHARAQERFLAAEAMGAQPDAAAVYLEAGDLWARAALQMSNAEVERLARMDLVRRALKAYDAAATRPAQAAALRLLDGYLGDMPQASELAAFERRRGELQAALRPTIAAPVIAVPKQEPAERPPTKPTRGLAIGLGLTAGLGVGALALGVGAWSQARRGGPLYDDIAAQANAMAQDHDLPAGAMDQSVAYCRYADAVEDSSLQGLCGRQRGLATASIAGFAAAGAAGVVVIVLAAVLGKRKAEARRFALLPTPGGLVFSGNFGRARGGR